MKHQRCFLVMLLFSGISLNSEACENSAIAETLESLTLVHQLHNCEIEVVSRDDEKGVRNYMMLVNDLLPQADHHRPEVAFDFNIEKSCLTAGSNSSLALRQLRYSYGFEEDGMQFRSALEIDFDTEKNIKKLMIQNIDLASGKITERVDCRYESRKK